MIPAQAALIDDTERLKQMILQRDAQLSAYMLQLSSQLQVVGASRLASTASHAWASGSSPTGDSLAVVSQSYAELHSISEVRTLGLPVFRISKHKRLVQTALPGTCFVRVYEK